ncbi:MAG: pectate lyase [Cellvibrionaceae bacterium]|nr:pectate lyase [Cellvibrionaceae bacterium]
MIFESKHLNSLGLVCLCIVLAACGGSDYGDNGETALTPTQRLTPAPTEVPATPTPPPTTEPTLEPSPTPDPDPLVDADCEELLSDPLVNWRDSSLQSDQEIVACLKNSLGTAVGFGEKASGGYDPQGASNLVIITKDQPEQQLLDAISSPEHNWIVFDKVDFASDGLISMHRLNCDEPLVLAALNNASEAQCRDPFAWCEANGIAGGDACLTEFFNVRLNNNDLPIRNQLIDSNTTIDGRGSKASLLFNGFKIGSDSGGVSTHISENVIVTNILFLGAGHTEDHGLDPDMLRVTGESHDVWIHQNTFKNSGDAAFDVKVGGYDTTISFNRVEDVKRAALHGSNDSREINQQITTTIHNNLFVTNRENYLDGNFGVLRRVPLLRRGQAHVWNNVFYNYGSEIASIRVGGRLLFEGNMVINNKAQSETLGITDLSVFQEDAFNFREGGLEVRDSRVWFADNNCDPIDAAVSLDQSLGETPEMLNAYSEAAQNTIAANLFESGADLLAYLKATAGKGANIPYLSSYAGTLDATIATAPISCLAPSP